MEFTWSRYETFLKFRADEADRNHQHILQISVTFTECLSSAQDWQFSTANSFKATTLAPIFSPMGSYNPSQHHYVISAFPTSKENTILTTEREGTVLENIEWHYFLITNYIIFQQLFSLGSSWGLFLFKVFFFVCFYCQVTYYIAVFHVALSVHLRKQAYKPEKRLQFCNRFNVKKVFVFSKTK